MTTEARKAECRELSAAELDDISGGTSGFMHAVAHAAEKYWYENGCDTIKTGDGKYSSCYGPIS